MRRLGTNFKSVAGDHKHTHTHSHSSSHTTLVVSPNFSVRLKGTPAKQFKPKENRNSPNYQNALGAEVGGALCEPASCAIMKHKKMQVNMWASILTCICAHANRLMNCNFTEKFHHAHCNFNRAAFRVAFPQENHYETWSHERVIHRPTS